MQFDTDVMVIGGGPAGLAAAIAARRRGFRVMVADAAKPPIDKACGEGLMPDALTCAEKLGFSIPVAAGHPFRGIRFVGAARSVEAAFPLGSGVGVRRTVLHSILIESAERAGVDLCWGCAVTGFEASSITLGRSRIRSRWIIGADGGRSAVRRWAGLDAIRRETRRFGFRRHFKIAPWTDCMEIHWGDGCQFYITPVSTREICLVLMSRDPHLRLADALPRFPALSARLERAAATTPERGAISSTCRFKRITRENIALIGDASGTVDAITGEGLCLAFQQAIVLADALAAGDLVRYEIAHPRVSRRPAFMAEFMLMLDRSAWLRDRALSALSSRPEVFANLLALHVGKLGVGDMAATGIRLGWGLVAA